MASGDGQVIAVDMPDDKITAYPLIISEGTGELIGISSEPVTVVTMSAFTQKDPLLDAIQTQLLLLADDPQVLATVLHALIEIRKHRYESEDELEGWLAASSFDFWDNDEDAIYDTL